MPPANFVWLWQDWQAAVVISDDGELLDAEILRGRLTKERIAERLMLMRTGVLLEQGRQLLERHPDAKRVEHGDEVLEGIDLPLPDEGRLELLDQAALLLSQIDVDAAASDPDRRLEHLVHAMDELRASWVLLEARLVEWLAMFLPRANLEASRDQLAKLVQNCDSIDELADLFDVSAPPISPADSEWRVLREWAEQVGGMRSRLDRIENSVRELASAHLPSLSALAGPLLAARLCVLAHGRMRLARLPAGTLQILGAEKAFFSHLKHGTKPPKHGVIFAHVLISRSPRQVRGRIARMLAARLSIASRLDAFEGEPWGEVELRLIEAKVEIIRQQHAANRR